MMDSPAPVPPVMPMPARPFLAYTVAFDAPGNGGCRQMARMLGASMARTAFGGDFLIVRNSPEPLFLVQREGVREFFVDSAVQVPEGACVMGTAKEAAEALAAEAM